MVRIETMQIPDSGRGLVSATPIAAGELVLRESPVILTVTQSLHNTICAFCLRYINAGASLECKGCGQASFCDEHCQGRANRQAHTETICRSMAEASLDTLDPDTADQARFIIQAQDLIDPERKGGALWRKKALALLQSSDEDHADTAEVLKWAEKYFGPEKWQTWKVAARKLASQDRINSYGIMAPPGPNGERRIRGSGVYPMSSLLNHDCMPNVARYDYFDGPQEENTIVEFRALHDIPADTQITQSYFPLSWNFEERQQRCKEQYGFQCICDRCQVEQHWQGLTDDESSDAAGPSTAHDQSQGSAQDEAGKDKHQLGGEAGQESDIAQRHGQGQKASYQKEDDRLDGQEQHKGEGEGAPGQVTEGEQRQSEQASEGGMQRHEGEQVLLEGHHEGQVSEAADRNPDEGQSTSDNFQSDSEEYEVPDEAYVMAYLGRHVCPQEAPSVGEEEAACGGTMTPVGVHGDTYACNMCGFERLESERVAQLEKMYQAVAKECGQ